MTITLHLQCRVCRPFFLSFFLSFFRSFVLSFFLSFFLSFPDFKLIHLFDHDHHCHQFLLPISRLPPPHHHHHHHHNHYYYSTTTGDGFSSYSRTLGEGSSNHSLFALLFQVEIARAHEFHCFRTGTFYSGSANRDDCRRAFPEGLKTFNSLDKYV